MKTIVLIIVMLNLFQHPSLSQDLHLVDSLETALKNHNAQKPELKIKSPSLYDTTAANILSSLSKAYWTSNLDKAMDYTNQCLALSEQISYKKGIGNAFNSMGVIEEGKGNYLPALEFHKKALKIREENGDKRGISVSYNNIGNIYNEQGNYPEALRYYFAALKIKEEIGDKKGIAASYVNIGVIYDYQGNYPEALKNYFACLKIAEEIGDKNIIAHAYGNMGVVYNDQGNYPEALKSQFAALKIKEEIGDKRGIATTYNNIANIYRVQGNYPEALKNQFAALKITEEIGDKRGMAIAYINIGKIYTRQNKYSEVSEYLNKGLSLSKEIGSLEWIKESYDCLATLDSAQGNFNKALEHYKLYITYRDSIENTENTKKAVALQMNYDFGKKQDSLNLVQASKDMLAQKELQKQKLVRNGFVGGFAVVLLFAGVFFRQRNKTKKEKLRAETALDELKKAQQELVEKEKLAAIGTVAQRMAHEIQNPLNFVNSFSELSGELTAELANAKTEEERQEIISTMKENMSKINHHGKRADNIIKKLQQHLNEGKGLEMFEK